MAASRSRAARADARRASQTFTTTASSRAVGSRITALSFALVLQPSRVDQGTCAGASDLIYSHG
jgi:hypothetical protein